MNPFAAIGAFLTIRDAAGPVVRNADTVKQKPHDHGPQINPGPGGRLPKVTPDPDAPLVLPSWTGPNVGRMRRVEAPRDRMVSLRPFGSGRDDFLF